MKNALVQISQKISATGSQEAGTMTFESKQIVAELEGMLQKEREEFEVAHLTCYSFPLIRFLLGLTHYNLE